MEDGGPLSVLASADVAAVAVGDPAHYRETQKFDLKRGSDDADLFQP